MGKCCQKGKESGETKSPHKYNAFRKENSLGRQRLRGKRVMRRPGYDLGTARGLEGFHKNELMERLSRGTKGTPAGETGKLEQS